MTNTFGMGTQLAASAMRLGWFYGVNRIVEREARRLGQRPGYKPKRPVPGQQELMAALGNMLLTDAENVRRGLYPPMEPEPGGPAHLVARVREMLADLPGALSRRASEEADSVRAEPGGAAPHPRHRLVPRSAISHPRAEARPVTTKAIRDR